MRRILKMCMEMAMADATGRPNENERVAELREVYTFLDRSMSEGAPPHLSLIHI